MMKAVNIKVSVKSTSQAADVRISSLCSSLATRMISSVCLYLLICTATLASSLNELEQLNDDQFNELGMQLGAATQYKSIAPSENQGLFGFDIGVSLSGTRVDDDLFDLASSGSVDERQLIVGRVHAQLGLPFGFDIGASLGRVPGIELELAGAEIRYAIVRGDALTPAIAIRATYSQAVQSDDFTLNNRGIDISISKGLLFLTPYAGLGIVRTSLEQGSSGSNLRSETQDLERLFVGTTINLGLAWTFEADRTEDLTSYSAKVGIRF